MIRNSILIFFILFFFQNLVVILGLEMDLDAAQLKSCEENVCIRLILDWVRCIDKNC